MQSKFRVESTADVPIWRATDPNYPGVPQPPEVLSRSTSRATVDYNTYVLAYSGQQRANVFVMVIGIVLAIGAAYFLSGVWLVLLAAVGVGLLMAGGVAFAVAADAHRSYTRDLAVSVSETYEPRNPPRPVAPETVRPFVPSANGDSRTTSTGRLDFTPAVWRDLFDRALARGGVITRDDVARPAGVGRRWYHGEGWGQFLEELTRLGFIDGRNRLTPAALQWYADTITLPLATIPVRSRNERTNGERTANERHEDAQWGGA